MNRGKFRGTFVNELMFFVSTTKEDLKNGFTLEEAEEEFIKYTSSFYGARLGFDVYALKKTHFISSNVSELIHGHIDETKINELCDDIEMEEEAEVRVGKL